VQDAPTITLALFAGLISFLSPCVLPLVPSYLGVLGGGQAAWKRAWGFVGGFSLIFVASGAGASLLGRLLRSQQTWLEPASGVLIVLFGIFMLGIFKPAFLMQERRMDLLKASSYGSVALGAAFAIGWTPCIGPIYGSILAIASAKSQLLEGVILLAAYAVGLAIPFLLAAVVWERWGLRRLTRYSETLERIGGVLLIVVGLLIATGQFSEISRVFSNLLPDWWKRVL
jgi:cytochrome c-type biogenesis protein